MYIMFSIVVIAIMYFITMYYIAEYIFDKKQSDMTIALFLAGVIAVLLGKYIIQSKSIASGLYYGGLLLIGLSIIGNWRNITNEYKLLLIVSAFIIALIYFYNSDNKTVS